MAEEPVNNEAEQPKAEKPKKSKKKLIIIIAGAVLFFSISGFFAYTMLYSKKDGHEEEDNKKGKNSEKAALVALDPFILNLAEQGRFLKVTIHFELADPSYQQLVENNTPQLKDAIIILLSSKSTETIASPEGKLQLKDEILLRANQTIGKDVIKNLYFTEFVMQ
jgi:flagellar FliL protein